MAVVINSLSTAITISDTEHRLVTSNGIITGSTPVNFSSSANLQTMTVMGAISGTTRGISMGENDIVTIGVSGLVEGRDSSGSDGIYVNGTDAKIEVSGRLYGEDIGVIGDLGSANLDIQVNDGGFIGGGGDGRGLGNAYSATLAIFGEDSIITNYGMIVAELNQTTGERVAFTNATFDVAAADRFDPTDDFVATFVNGGTVLGDVRFQAGNDTYRGQGDGVVVGRIDMGTGVDLMIGGSQRDNVNGGAGNDALIGRGGDDMLIGFTGNDVVRGGKGDDEVIGGDGADNLYGGNGDDDIVSGRGADMITGGRGDDIMRGAGGFDTFIFKAGFDHDIIEDFAGANAEKIDLSAVKSIRNFNDLTNNHLSQDGADAVIDAGNGNTITLEGFNAGALNAGDFIF